MQDYSWMRLLKDNPEWASLCATVLFATITTAIIWRQVCVMQAQARIMKWQAKYSFQHEKQQNKLLEKQNKLIRFQFEYAWLREVNAERLKLTNELRDVCVLTNVLQSAGPIPEASWVETKGKILDLDAKLRILATMFTEDDWYGDVVFYLGALRGAVAYERERDIEERLDSDRPNPMTLRTFSDANHHFKPLESIAKIERAIQTNYFEFKHRWDVESKA